MRSRLGIISILLLLIPLSFAANCRTCKGKECEKENVEFRECTKFSAILPPETYSILPKVRESLEYGCLRLEYQNGKAIDVLQKCIITEDRSTVCQNIANSVPYTSCSVEPPRELHVEKEAYVILSQPIQHNMDSNEESNALDSTEREMTSEIAQGTDIFSSDDDTTVKQYKSETTTVYTFGVETIKNTPEATKTNYFEDQSNIDSTTPLSWVENESESLTEMVLINPSFPDVHFGEATGENSEDSSESDSTSIFPGLVSDLTAVTSDNTLTTQSSLESETTNFISDDPVRQTTVRQTTSSYDFEDDLGPSIVPMSLSDESEKTTDSQYVSTSFSESDVIVPSFYKTTTNNLAEGTLTNYLEIDSTTVVTFSESEPLPDLVFISASITDDYSDSEMMADASFSEDTVGAQHAIHEATTPYYFENDYGTESTSQISISLSVETEKTTNSLELMTASSSEEDISNMIDDAITSSFYESTTDNETPETTTPINYSSGNELLPDFVHIIVSDLSVDETTLENTQTTSANYLEGHSETDSSVNYDTTTLIQSEIIEDSAHTTVVFSDISVDNIETTTSETIRTSESLFDSTSEIDDKELTTESFPGITQFLPDETFGITTEELVLSSTIDPPEEKVTSQSIAQYSTISVVTDNSYIKTTVVSESEASDNSEELIISTTELFSDSISDEDTTFSFQIATSDLDDTHDSSIPASPSDSADNSISFSPTNVPSNALDAEHIKVTTTEESSVPLIEHEGNFTQPESTAHTEDPSDIDNDNNCNSASKIEFPVIMYTIMFVIYTRIS